MFNVRVESRMWDIARIVEKVHRNDDSAVTLWEDHQKSLLAEALILRIPAPIMYITDDPNNEGKFVAVGDYSKCYLDALHSIVMNLQFSGVELSELKESTFVLLSRPLQRQLLETDIPVRIVDNGLSYVEHLIDQGIF